LCVDLWLPGLFPHGQQIRGKGAKATTRILRGLSFSTTIGTTPHLCITNSALPRLILQLVWSEQHNLFVVAEVYSTAVRASTHGFSPAEANSVLFPSLSWKITCTSTPNKSLYVVPWFDLIRMFITTLFLPDIAGIDIKK
jgi:hypothetical protein